MPTTIIAGTAVISISGSNQPNHAAIAIARVDRCAIVIAWGITAVICRCVSTSIVPGSISIPIVTVTRSVSVGVRSDTPNQSAGD
jgi:hypothetical protein